MVSDTHSGQTSDWTWQFNSASILMLIQLVLLFTVLYLTGNLNASIANDTDSYEAVLQPGATASHIFSQRRTIGYPLFLKLSACFGDGHQPVPVLQFLIHFSAIIVFWRSLRIFFRRQLSAAIAASGMLYSSMVFRYVHVVAPDMLACSLAIAAVGVLLMLAAAPRRRSLWMWLALLLFLTYQVRPAYQFLIVLVPVLGMTVRWWLTDKCPLKTVRLGTGLLATGMVPLILFCTARWAVVGQFGLVSFGGYNLAALSGLFLNDDTVDQLPEDLQELGDAMLIRKQQIVDRQIAESGLPVGSYLAMEAQYDNSLWEVFYPAARSVYGNDPVIINAKGLQFSKAVLTQQPRTYIVWLVKAARQGIRMVFSELVVNPFNFVVLALLCLTEFRNLIRIRSLRIRHDSQNLSRSAGPTPDNLLQPVRMLTLVAVLFAAFKLLLIILVVPPLGRFTDAASIFFPTILLASLCGSLAGRPQLEPQQPDHQG
jgi:hypothetical protein